MEIMSSLLRLNLKEYEQQILDWFKFVLLMLWLCLNEITINYVLFPFFYLLIHIRLTFFLQMYVLNLLTNIMTVKKIDSKRTQRLDIWKL